MRITSDAGRIGPFIWINSNLIDTPIRRLRVQVWGGFAWRGLPNIEAEIIR